MFLEKFLFGKLFGTFFLTLDLNVLITSYDNKTQFLSLGLSKQLFL